MSIDQLVYRANRHVFRHKQKIKFFQPRRSNNAQLINRISNNISYYYPYNSMTFRD
ncbi:hypothetical protein J6590_074086, partial [Homalodisca vitripennis]